MADIQAKRDANMAQKEAERKKKNDEIAARKKEGAAKRAEEQKKKEDEEKAAEQKKKDLDEKRSANIAAKEGDRKKKAEEIKASKAGGGNTDREKARAAREAKSKYSKKDVHELKKVFDQYDKDGSGKVTLDEFTTAIKKHKDDSAPRPGDKSTLEERNRSKGISILDLSEGVFHEMDTDGDGDVTFAELLKLMFKFARQDEIETMLSWVAPEPEPEPEPKPELSPEAVKAIRQIFKLYDKDKSGSLTLKELRQALEKTGIDPDDVKTYFNEYDEDGNAEISSDEFFKLMESTGAFEDM